MEREKIGVSNRLGMKGLKNRGIVEISEDKKTGEYVLVVSKGIQRKGLVFNFPEEMWRVRCSKDEVVGVINEFLVKDVLG